MAYAVAYPVTRAVTYAEANANLGGVLAGIDLSNATIPDTTSSGSTVGTLSVRGGTGVYTFTLTSNPGAHFSITGTALKTSGSLTAATYPITVHADNGAGSTFDRSFLVTVTATSAALPEGSFFQIIFG